MKHILHKAETRGFANHSWLKSYHTFSFGNYYNPERMHFGALRVLNDDSVEGGRGFGEHPHDNMEIISIPLEGNLAHKDSMGNEVVIKSGDIQVMSAGTGVYHSEYNQNKNEWAKFLQIWIYPNKKNIDPRYDQKNLKVEDRHNKLQQILSPDPTDNGVWIYQDSWFSLGKFDPDIRSEYKMRKEGNGVYVFILKGEITLNGIKLSTRDGLGIWETNHVELSADSEVEFLLMEVPMKF